MTGRIGLLFLACVTALALALPGAGAKAAGPTLVVDTSEQDISIESGFQGESLLVYGAILGLDNPEKENTYDVVVQVEGPLRARTVREKKRVAGIWVNAESRDFRSVPLYYGMASTRPIDTILDRDAADIYQIGLDHMAFSPVGKVDDENILFEKGLIDLKMRGNLYSEQDEGVDLTDNVLYRARIEMPGSVPVGRYRVRAYLVEDGQVIASASSNLMIGKRGFEQFVETAAESYGFLYGLVAVLISLGFGYVAGYVFRRMG